jgi:hypothetical protein
VLLVMGLRPQFCSTVFSREQWLYAVLSAVLLVTAGPTRAA